VYPSDELAHFAVDHFPAKNLFHLLLGIDVHSSEKFHQIFLDFFTVQFSNARSPQIEPKHFSLLKTYQALRNTGMGRRIIATHFNKRGCPGLDDIITIFINTNFFLFATVAKDVGRENVLCTLLSYAFKDICSRILYWLGPLSLWHLEEEPLPSLFAVDVVPNTRLHNHPLTERDEYEPPPFVCNGKTLNGCTEGNGRRFICNECDFNLCPTCWGLYKGLAGEDGDINKPLETEGGEEDWGGKDPNENKEKEGGKTLDVHEE